MSSRLASPEVGVVPNRVGGGVLVHVDSVIHLVDLAGSERVSRSGAVGTQFKVRVWPRVRGRWLGAAFVWLFDALGLRSCAIPYRVCPDIPQEACAINKSLSALGDVIAALAQKSKHIPFRNSKVRQRAHILLPCSSFLCSSPFIVCTALRVCSSRGCSADEHTAVVAARSKQGPHGRERVSHARAVRVDDFDAAVWHEGQHLRAGV